MFAIHQRLQERADSDDLAFQLVWHSGLLLLNRCIHSAASPPDVIGRSHPRPSLRRWRNVVRTYKPLRAQAGERATVFLAHAVLTLFADQVDDSTRQMLHDETRGMRERFPLPEADRQFITSTEHESRDERNRHVILGALTLQGLTLAVGEQLTWQLPLFQGLPADWHDWQAAYGTGIPMVYIICLITAWDHAVERFADLVGFAPIEIE